MRWWKFLIIFGATSENVNESKILEFPEFVPLTYTTVFVCFFKKIILCQVHSRVYNLGPHEKKKLQDVILICHLMFPSPTHHHLLKIEFRRLRVAIRYRKKSLRGGKSVNSKQKKNSNFLFLFKIPWRKWTSHLRERECAASFLSNLFEFIYEFSLSVCLVCVCVCVR